MPVAGKTARVPKPGEVSEIEQQQGSSEVTESDAAVSGRTDGSPADDLNEIESLMKEADGEPGKTEIGFPELSPNLPSDLKARAQDLRKEMDRVMGNADIAALHVTQGLQRQIEELRGMFNRLSAEMKNVPGVAADGIVATSIGIVCCPKCDMRMEGGSLTGIAGSLYVHPYGASPKLNGALCEYRGRKFKAPVVFLELVK